MRKWPDWRSLWRTAGDDPVVALERACVRAGADFQGAAAELRSALERLPDNRLAAALNRHLAATIDSDGTVACVTYLLADARSVDAARSYAQTAAAQGCRSESFLIAFAGILGRGGDKAGATAVLIERASAASSVRLLTAVADRLRDDGRGWQVEHFLSGLIAGGRSDLRVRLAEHFIEFRLWPEARATLLDHADRRTEPYPLYLLGRASAGLLLEDEVIAAIAGLGELPDPGPSFAAALSALWSWRVDAEKPKRPGATKFVPYLVARDLRGLPEEQPHSPPQNPNPSRLAIDPDWRGRISALSIGPQRTASTWLCSQLGARNDVYAPAAKEAVGFFDSHNGEKIAARSGDPIERAYWSGPTRNLHDYMALFDRSQPVRIDFSPVYAELPEDTVELIRKILGSDTRIILGARDPVERAWSHLKFDLKIIGRAIADLSREDRFAHYNSSVSRRRGDLVTAYTIWRRHFDHIALVHYDDVVTQPEAVITELESFLGLRPQPSANGWRRANESTPDAMPVEDRAHLLSLYGRVYDLAEGLFGQRVSQWRRRQTALIAGHSDPATATSSTLKPSRVA